MGSADQAKNAIADLTGKAKEAIGDATNKDDLKAEGRADQAKAKTKKAGEDVKDAFKN